MSQLFDNPEHLEQPRQESGREPEITRDRRQPFDNSGLDDIPPPRSDDPPYRDWWAVENFGGRGALGSTARRKQD